MSDDLISRKTLLEEIRSFRCSITGLRAGKGVLASAADEYRKSILQIIEDQQTAFDKEKVIDEIKKYVGIPCPLHECGIRSEYCSSCMAKKAIEIVEKGGIE